MANYIATIPSFATPMIRNSAKKMTYQVGIGRHSDEEVQQMVVKDLRMFSEIIGAYYLTEVTGIIERAPIINVPSETVLII